MTIEGAREVMHKKYQLWLRRVEMITLEAQLKNAREKITEDYFVKEVCKELKATVSAADAAVKKFGVAVRKDPSKQQERYSHDIS